MGQYSGSANLVGFGRRPDLASRGKTIIRSTWTLVALSQVFEWRRASQRREPSHLGGNGRPLNLEASVPGLPKKLTPPTHALQTQRYFRLNRYTFSFGALPHPNLGSVPPYRSAFCFFKKKRKKKGILLGDKDNYNRSLHKDFRGTRELGAWGPRAELISYKV